MTRVVSERLDVIPLLAEVFREHGFEGASLAIITDRTGLGKGSLYHFFPGGKEEMVAAVLADISAWFETNVFAALAEPSDPRSAIVGMLDSTDAYFRSGSRVCLVGALAIDHVRDRFPDAIKDYFARWIDTLANALRCLGQNRSDARSLAEEVVAGIQGALVLARAIDDPEIFTTTIRRYKNRIIAL